MDHPATSHLSTALLYKCLTRKHDALVDYYSKRATRDVDGFYTSHDFKEYETRAAQLARVHSLHECELFQVRPRAKCLQDTDFT